MGHNMKKSFLFLSAIFFLNLQIFSQGLTVADSAHYWNRDYLTDKWGNKTDNDYFWVFQDGTLLNTGEKSIILFYLSFLPSLEIFIPGIHYYNLFGTEEDVTITIKHESDEFRFSGFIDSYENHIDNDFSSSTSILIKPFQSQKQAIDEFKQFMAWQPLCYALLNYESFDILIEGSDFKVRSKNPREKLNITESTAGPALLVTSVISEDTSLIKKTVSLFDISKISKDYTSTITGCFLSGDWRDYKNNNFETDASERFYDSNKMINFLIKNGLTLVYNRYDDFWNYIQKIHQKDKNSKRSMQLVEWFSNDILKEPSKKNIEIAHALLTLDYEALDKFYDNVNTSVSFIKLYDGVTKTEKFQSIDYALNLIFTDHYGIAYSDRESYGFMKNYLNFVKNHPNVLECLYTNSTAGS